MVATEFESRRRYRSKRLPSNLNLDETKCSLLNLNLDKTKRLLPNLNLEECIGLNDHC